MTVSSPNNRQLYAGDGTTTQFSYDFLVLEAAELLVVLRQADDVEQTKILDTDYSVAGAGLGEGGQVTCLTFTPADGEQLLIQRRVDLVQETSLPANVDMPSATIERQLDRLVMISQQLSDRLDRAIQLPLTSALTEIMMPEPSPGQAIVGNGDGTGYNNLDLVKVGGLAVSEFMRTVLADTGPAQALQTLGVANATFSPGDIKWSAKTLAADPSGWLLCDGRAVSRSTYADLFTALGPAHGQGDGSTTFNIPDYRGRALRCPDDLGTAAGAAGIDSDAATRTAMASGGNTGGGVGSIQTDALQGHTHTDSGHDHDYIRNWSNGSETVSANTDNKSKVDTTELGYASLGDPVENANGLPRLADETRMVNAYVNVLIKT